MTNNSHLRQGKDFQGLSVVDIVEGGRPRSDFRQGRPWTGELPVRLSMLMPVYNEQSTIGTAVADILAAPYPCPTELIVVDDGSTDSTGDILDELDDPRVVVHRHPTNLGKGAALHTAAAMATGTHIVPFDADLEYAANDLGPLITPVLEGRHDVVYGTRLFGANTRYQSYRHAMGNRGLTLAANVLFDSYLSDIHTCLKLMPLELFRAMDLRENGFGLDTEMTALILKLGIRPFEIPVSYHSRSVDQGKKLSSLHGVECLKVLLRVRLSRRPPVAVDPSEDVASRARTRTNRFKRASDGERSPLKKSATGG